MKKIQKNTLHIMFFFCLFFPYHLLHTATDENQLLKMVRKQIKKTRKISEQLREELEELQQILSFNSELEKLLPIQPKEDPDGTPMSHEGKIFTDKGVTFFQEKKWEWAREEFQKAWEKDPNHPVSAYNLGLVHYHLGNASLAKKMLSSALEIDPSLPHADKIKIFSGEWEKEDKEEEPLSKEAQFIVNELKNISSEISSYLQLSTFSRTRKMSLIIPLLQKMEKKITSLSPLSFSRLSKDFFPMISDHYALFEWYKESLELLEKYEESMKGEVLPKGYHTKKLELEEKKNQQNQLFETYLNNQPEEKIRRKLQKNSEELEIFAVQFDQFIHSIEKDQEDFQKITHRLKEFRWGGKAGRHVLIINPYEEIIFSSLSQTLPLERYRDQQGRYFFKDLALLKDRLSLKQVEFTSLELSLGNQSLSYLLLYTYIPKHNIFIIIKIPYEDLL